MMGWLSDWERVRTAYYFVEEIGRRIKEEGLQITAVTTSSVTSKQAEGLNIPLKSIDQVDFVDVTSRRGR